eukprot:403337119
MISRIGITLSVLLTLGIDNAQAGFRMGACPDYQLMENFDATRYVGKWYEIYRDKDTTFEAGTNCCVVNYGLIGEGKVSVYNRAIYDDSGEVNSIRGIATCKGSNCKVKFDPFYIPPGPYFVVDTDYSNYAVVYSCTNYLFGLFKEEATLMFYSENKQ